MACEIEFKWKSDNEKVIESASDFVKELVNDTGSSLKQNCIEDDVYSVVIETECKNFGAKILILLYHILLLEDIRIDKLFQSFLIYGQQKHIMPQL